MTKEEILNQISEILNTVSTYNLSKFVKKNHPDLYKEIEERTAELNKFRRLRWGRTDVYNDISILERIYCIEHDLTDRPKCQYCGKEYVCNFNTQTREYKKWCCPSCQASDPSCTKKSKETRKEKYGDENYSGVEKARQTRYEKNGGCWHDGEFVDKSKATKLKNHGDPNYTNTEKRLVTIDKMIEENPDYYKERGEKISETKLKNHGDPNYNNREKFKNTLSNFTDEKRQSIVDKRKNTCLENYGVEYVLQDPEVRKRVEELNLKNFGFRTGLLKPEAKDKMRETKRRESVETYRAETKYTPLFTDEEFIYGEYNPRTKAWKWKCNKCGEEFLATYHSGTIHGRCPKCEPRRFHVAQTEVFNFIRSLNVSGMDDFRDEVWGVIDGRYIDMCSLNGKFGIEYDGLFWHSVDNKVNGDRITEDYHKRKTDECEKNGFRLIHITDMEWVDNQKLCRGIFKRILNKKRWSVDSKQCEVCEPTKDEVQKFIRKYSFVRNVKYSRAVCLKNRNRIVSMITLEKVKDNGNESDYKITRYATLNNFNVVGDFSKMVDYVWNNVNPVSIVYYLDRRWFNSNDIPEGFEEDGRTPQNLHWFDKGFMYNKNCFSGDLLASQLQKYDPEKSMSENMADNGYMRYYDCGNIVCVMRR